MSASKYITKSDLIAWIENQAPMVTQDDIPDQVLKLADARIDSFLIGQRVKVTSNMSDPLNLLWSAALCMCLEMLSYRQVITWSTGDIAMHQLNRVTHQYQRWQPMFFFATGASEPFMGLLPHETYRMMAFAFCKQYAMQKFYDDYGRWVAIPKIVMDETSRGYRWNISGEEVEAEDVEIESQDGFINAGSSFDYPLDVDPDG